MKTIILTVVLFSCFIAALSQECGRKPSIRSHSCCESNPNLMSREIVEKCGERLEKRKGPPTCEAIKCILAENNLIANDQIDKEGFKAFLEKQFTSEWQPAIQKTMDACESENLKPGDCPVGNFMKCFKRNMILNCPEKFWNPKEECNELRNFIKNCSN